MDESPLDAARRGLLEAAGIYVCHLHEIGSFLTNNRRSAAKKQVFLATELEYRTAQPEDAQSIAYEWVPMAEIDQPRTGDLGRWNGKERHGKVIFGALGIGGLEMKIHRSCVARLFEQNDLVLDVEEVYATAREIGKESEKQCASSLPA